MKKQSMNWLNLGLIIYAISGYLIWIIMMINFPENGYAIAIAGINAVNQTAIYFIYRILGSSRKITNY